MRANADLREIPIYRCLVMGSENPYPTFGAPPQRPRRTSGTSLGMVLLYVFGGFVVLLVVGFKLIDCAKGDEIESRPAAVCDRKAEATREEWLLMKVREYDDASPHDSGYRASGFCSTSLESRSLTCDRGTVIGIERDAPFARDAALRGFTTFVCIDIANERRTEIPIRDVVKR